jgi:hypothetical protein
MTTKNLFLYFHEKLYGSDEDRFGKGWEDLFTEQLAFFLVSDIPAATALARMLVGANDVEVADVSPQVTTEDGRPDLSLDLVRGGRIFIEHKFDAPLREGQLQDYLKCGKVALVSHRMQPIHDDVLAHLDYLRPTDRLFLDGKTCTSVFLAARKSNICRQRP